MSFNQFLILIVWLSVNSISADRVTLQDIVRTCHYEGPNGCRLDEHQEKVVDTIGHQERMYHFVTTGPGRIFWDKIDLNSVRTNLTNGPCLEQLVQVRNSIRDGDL